MVTITNTAGVLGVVLGMLLKERQGRSRWNLKGVRFSGTFMNARFHFMYYIAIHCILCTGVKVTKKG